MRESSILIPGSLNTFPIQKFKSKSSISDLFMLILSQTQFLISQWPIIALQKSIVHFIFVQRLISDLEKFYF